MEGEAYFDVVWKQFRKNRIAVWMLWIVAALFLVGIFAPVLASNQPYWFRETDGSLRFPWLVSLFNADTAIDFVFNSALILFFPWLLASLYLNQRARGRKVPGRRRLGMALLLFFAGLAVAVPACHVLRPDNKYFARDFKRDQIQGQGSGSYTFIPYGPLEVDLDTVFKEPLFRKTADFARYRDNQMHLMGTDDSGRDVLTRLLYGTRISITIGILAVSIYLTIGICIGAVAGYFGGRVDMMISRVIEIVLLFPSFFLILTLVALIGPSIYIIMIVIGLTNWPTTARLTRGEFLKQRAIDYVQAARGLGASNARVMFRHILPNALSPAFVSAPFGIAGAIVTEATLSVLGFGARPPAPSWGSLLYLSVQNYAHWWFTVFAGLSIFLTMTVFNIVGNALRDAMDPRLKGTQ
ncbi:MAG TPA: ABC transporter permease [Planctomycetota bacterium]|nr:ABC transporter permease [Planctomycetota bacterium]